MQVTHVADHVTHAIIGGNEMIEAGFANSAALMHALSATLYSDPRLATVREVVCNAWDAHISSGRTDQYLKISLTSNRMIIRDFGNGIAPNMMKTLYATYGGTDKTLDDKQTGGFGLGKFAPYSYTDEFETQSFHEGIRTIYAMSKSSAERNGKPSIMPIGSFPTTESGFQVSIPIEPQDYDRFQSLLVRICTNGSMKANIDGQMIHGGLPFSEDGSYLITLEEVLDTHQTICLRYGNVIYPVEEAAGLRKEWRDVANVLRRLGDRSYNRNTSYKIIFQAPGHSISVTPSRESLAMQERTVETIKGLMVVFLASIKSLPEECLKFLDQRIEQVKQAGYVGELLNGHHCLPRLPNRPQGLDLRIVNSLPKMAEQTMIHDYPSLPGFRDTDIDKRIEAAMELKAAPLGHLRMLRRLIKRPTTKMVRQASNKNRSRKHRDWGSMIEGTRANDWFKKRVLRKLYRDIQADGMKAKSLYIHSQSQSHSDSDYLMDAVTYRRNAFVDYLPIMRRIVVLSATRSNIGNRISKAPEMAKLGETSELFVYLTTAKKTLPAIREFFTSRGYTLIDLTAEAPWIPVKVKPPISTVPVIRKPRKEGFPALSGTRKAIDDAGNEHHRLDYVMLEGKPRVTEPLFYYEFTLSRSDVRDFKISYFDRDASALLVELWGAQAAAVYTTTQVEKLKEANVPTLNAYVLPYIIDQVTKAPQFLAYWAESMENAVSFTTANRDEVVALFDIPEVRKAMGLGNHLNQQDLVVLKLWRSMVAERRFEYAGKEITAQLAAAKAELNQIKLNKSIINLVAKFNGGSLVGLLHMRQLTNTVHQTDAAKNGVPAKVAQLVKLALLG